MWRVGVSSGRRLAQAAGNGSDCVVPLQGQPAGSNHGAYIDLFAPGHLVWTTSLRSQENIDAGEGEWRGRKRRRQPLVPGPPSPAAACAAAGRCTAAVPLPLLPRLAAGSYTQVTGTSVATALVGGVAGLILSASRNGAAFDMIGCVRDAILAGADSVPALQALGADGLPYCAAGRRLNAYNALAAFVQACAEDTDGWPWLPPALRGFVPASPPPPPVRGRGAAQPLCPRRCPRGVRSASWPQLGRAPCC
jgi:subtilisin family serine protease